MIAILNVILGGALLIAGRRLFWLLVGAIGFLIGVELASRYIHGSEVLLLIGALVVGAIFALVAVFVESVAIGLAGFLGGGYALLGLASLAGLSGGTVSLIVFVVGGILGVLLTVLLFDWALITISSLAGASMIVASIALRASSRPVVYLGLVLAGVLIQGLSMRQARATGGEKA